MKRLAVFLLIAAVLFAQAGNKKLTFEVVSIKLNNSGSWGQISAQPEGRFTASNVHLRQLIVAAYVDSSAVLQDIEISGLPKWAETDGFDVQTQPEAGFSPTKQQTKEMLQAMLEDRFKLKIRRGTKSTPIYTLVVDKGGLKMKLSESVDAVGASGSKIDFGQIHESRKPIGLLVMYLTGRAAGRMIVDKTGLTGLYDIDLKWTPDLLANGVGLPPGAETDAPGPSLFTALQEQLGLRLVSETGQVDAFVVESVEKPTEN